jgi:hypothetical protein
MPKTQAANSNTAVPTTVSSATQAPGHLQVTVSGPAEHVMAALTNMKFQQPVTIALCQQIALTETGSLSADPTDTLGDLGMGSPALTKAYTQRCVLDLLQQTGCSVQASQLPQDSTTTVQQVAEAMYDATT